VIYLNDNELFVTFSRLVIAEWWRMLVTWSCSRWRQRTGPKCRM